MIAVGLTVKSNGSLLSYQRAAAEKIARELCERGRAAVVAPPRTGKLVMVAAALEARPRCGLLVLTPSVEAFQRRIRRLPEPLRSHMSEGRVVAYARVASMDEAALGRLWRPLIVLDSFQRCGSERWGEAARRLVDDPRGAGVIGISAYSLRPSDGGRDMVREFFGGRYAFRMELPEAWASPEVPLEPPTFVEALLSWDDDLAGMRSRASGIASPSARRMARERLTELEAALSHLGRSDGEVVKHVPRADGHYVVYCSRVADVARVRGVLTGWLKTVNGRISSYQATYDVGAERAREAIAAYAGDRSGALKLLFVIDKLRDWGEVPCDGAFCFRRTRSVNVLAGQVAQASRLAGSGESVFVDLAGNLESAGVWEGRGPGLRERDGAAKSLLDYVSGHIVVTERTMRAVELLRRMDALLSGYGVKSIIPAPAERAWSREEDAVLADYYISHGLRWDGWEKALPNRSRKEIERRAFVLGVKFGMPARWSAQDDKTLRRFYPKYGAEWGGWQDCLPRKTTKQIRQRALQLGLSVPPSCKGPGVSGGSREHSEKGSGNHRAERQTRMGWTRETEEMFEYLYGKTAPRDLEPLGTKKASEREIKRFEVWKRGLRLEQLEWLDGAIRRLYPILGAKWEGWQLLVPNATPAAIKSRARILGVRDEWQRVLRSAKGLGWSGAECEILRAEYTLRSGDDGFWEARLLNRSDEEVPEMARKLHIPSWQDVLSIAREGTSVGVMGAGGDVWGVE